MRKKNQKQLPLMNTTVNHPHAHEYAEISQILDQNPIIYELVLQDLLTEIKCPGAGAEGMSADQVLRATIIKKKEGYSYEALAFHIVDSNCFRNFCRIGIGDKGFSKSALCNNIKAIKASTWESINIILIGHSEETNVEKGRETRVDCTVVSSNIHDPKDSELLWDSVRVLTRILETTQSRFPDLKMHFHNHKRRAKRRMLGILNAKNKTVRNQLYIDLIRTTQSCITYARNTVELLQKHVFEFPYLLDSIKGVVEQLDHYIDLATSVVSQAERRIVYGEKVPAVEKVVSIFEPHTDIIVKDRRETFYGHKICLTGGKSNLILDCVILDGNPADSKLTAKMIERQKDIYGRYPLKVALDGGFASKENLKVAKGKGIKDVCFSKGRGLKEEDMCRSGWVYKRLRKFRAGIESGISWLKRSFGLSVCTWKGYESFKSYVWSSIVSANLLTLARKKLATH